MEAKTVHLGSRADSPLNFGGVVGSNLHGRKDTGLQSSQVQEVSFIERQFDDSDFLDHLSHRGIAGFYGDSTSLHHHFVGNFTDLQLDADL